MSKKKLSIYLVDDDAMHLDMLKSHLDQAFDAEITTFQNGEDLLAHVNGTPDIIVLDYNLDSQKKDAQNGIEVLQQVKAKDEKAQVIMLSGQDNINVAVDTMRYGAYDYVVKNEAGFVRTENCINNILRQQSLERSLRTSNRAAIFMVVVVLAIIAFSLIIYIFFPELVPERAKKLGLE